MPMPSKRTSVMAISPKNKISRRISDSSSDDDSILNESSSTTSEREKSRRNFRRPFSIDNSVPNSSDTSTHSSPAHERQYPYRFQQVPQQQQQPALPPRIVGLHEHVKNSSSKSSTPDITKHNHGRKSNIQSHPLPPPPQLTPQPPYSNQSQLLKQYQMNLPLSRVNGSQSHQISTPDVANEKPPDRPERISSRISDNNSINHLTEALQHMTPLSFNLQQEVPETPPISHSETSSNSMSCYILFIFLIDFFRRIR